MKIGELSERCGMCPLIDFCTEPYCTPQICDTEELADVDVYKYKELAENVEPEEIAEKIEQYEDAGIGSPWDDMQNGAILDIVLEQLQNE